MLACLILSLLAAFMSLSNSLINTLSGSGFCSLSARHLLLSVPCVKYHLSLVNWLSKCLTHRYRRLPSQRLRCPPCWCILVALMSQTACPRHPRSPRPRHRKPLEGRGWSLCSLYLPSALFVQIPRPGCPQCSPCSLALVLSGKCQT